MTRAERIRAAEQALRIARRLMDLADEHHRIGDGIMEVAARTADEARRIAEGDIGRNSSDVPTKSVDTHH